MRWALSIVVAAAGCAPVPTTPSSDAGSIESAAPVPVPSTPLDAAAEAWLRGPSTSLGIDGIPMWASSASGGTPLIWSGLADPRFGLLDAEGVLHRRRAPLAEATAYFPCAEGIVAALDRGAVAIDLEGRERWRVPFGGALRGVACGAQDRLLVESGDGLDDLRVERGATILVAHHPEPTPFIVAWDGAAWITAEAAGERTRLSRLGDGEIAMLDARGPLDLVSDGARIVLLSTSDEDELVLHVLSECAGVRRLLVARSDVGITRSRLLLGPGSTIAVSHRVVRSWSYRMMIGPPHHCARLPIVGRTEARVLVGDHLTPPMSVEGRAEVALAAGRLVFVDEDGRVAIFAQP